MCKSYRLHVYFIVTNCLRRQRCNNTSRYPNLCKVCSNLEDQIPPRNKNPFFQGGFSGFCPFFQGWRWDDRECGQNSLIYNALSSRMTWRSHFFQRIINVSLHFFQRLLGAPTHFLERVSWFATFSLAMKMKQNELND